MKTQNFNQKLLSCFYSHLPSALNFCKVVELIRFCESLRLFLNNNCIKIPLNNIYYVRFHSSITNFCFHFRTLSFTDRLSTQSTLSTYITIIIKCFFFFILQLSTYSIHLQHISHCFPMKTVKCFPRVHERNISHFHPVHPSYLSGSSKYSL